MRDIQTTLEALREAFNAHDLDAIMAYFADDCVLEMPRGPDSWGARSEGKAAVREALAGRFQGLPDVHYGDATHLVDADTGISKWVLTGTTPEGLRLEVRGCDFYTFRDGLVIVRRQCGRLPDGRDCRAEDTVRQDPAADRRAEATVAIAPGMSNASNQRWQPEG